MSNTSGGVEPRSTELMLDDTVVFVAPVEVVGAAVMEEVLGIVAVTELVVEAAA